MESHYKFSSMGVQIVLLALGAKHLVCRNHHLFFCLGSKMSWAGPEHIQKNPELEI